MPTNKPRYTITVDEELMKQIDDFRFENRYPSRSAATLELIRLGMEQLAKKQEEVKMAQITDDVTIKLVARNKNGPLEVKVNRDQLKLAVLNDLKKNNNDSDLF